MVSKEIVDERNEYSAAMLKRIAARLKAFRIQKGYRSYENFAIRHGISRSQYGKYEKGQNLGMSTLVVILREMGVSLREFFSEGFDED